jgi:hypothetical protein
MSDFDSKVVDRFGNTAADYGPTGQPGGNTYKVKSGDSWAKIAGQLTGNDRNFAAIMNANGGGVLHPGDIIYIPNLYGQKPNVTNTDIAKANSLQSVANAFNGVTAANSKFMAITGQLQDSYKINPTGKVAPIDLENSNFLNYKTGSIQTGSGNLPQTGVTNGPAGTNANPSGSYLSTLPSDVQFGATNGLNRSFTPPPSKSSPAAQAAMSRLNSNGDLQTIGSNKTSTPGNTPLHNAQVTGNQGVVPQTSSPTSVPSYMASGLPSSVSSPQMDNFLVGLTNGSIKNPTIQDFLSAANGDEALSQQLMSIAGFEIDPVTGVIFESGLNDSMSLATQDLNMYEFARSLGVPSYVTPDWLRKYYEQGQNGGGDGGGQRTPTSGGGLANGLLNLKLSTG